MFLTLTKTKEFLCLDLETGEELWRVSSKGDRLVCYLQGILFSQYMGKGSNQEEVVFNAAYSARDGRHLWRYDYAKVWHGGHPHNVFFLDGLAWVLTSIASESVPYTKEPQAWHGVDMKSGKVVRRIDWEKTKHRCYGDRATERYIISGGIDFLDVETGRHCKFLGGRGSCSFGHMPANGLVYQLPNTCQCYSQVRGFVAFAADASTASRGDELQDEKRRLTGTGKPADETPSPEDWPMLRRDPARNGSTTAVLPGELAPVWKQTFDGRLSSPVAACGKVFVSSIDEHRVLALDMKTGRTVWSYRANGRVDSPPTIHAGKAVFGCRDGWVCCVSSATGELIWSLQAAPRQRWLLCRGQVESAWPVHGSVLVEEDAAYFSAGRHSHVDGGVFLYAASPETGEVLWQKRLDVDSLPPAYANPGNVSSDILVSNGKSIFMQKVGFDAATGDQSEERASFRSGTGGGFLTDNLHLLGRGHDLYRRWRYDASGIGGLALAFAEESIFGIGIGIGKNLYKFKVSDGLEIFRCSKKEGAEKIFWQSAVPEGVLPKAILPAGGKVYVAVAREDDGRSKGTIMIHDAGDGKTLGTIPLDVKPKFDGLAVVNGHLIVVGENGDVTCLGEEKGTGSFSSLLAGQVMGSPHDS